MFTDPTGEAGTVGSGATYTVYKATFYVKMKKQVSYYSKHTNNAEDKVGTLPEGHLQKIAGGYGSMFAFACNGGVYFINKSDVKPYKELDEGTYFIKNLETGKYWDVKGAKTDNNTPVIQYDFHGGTNQQWKFTYGSDGFYQLSPVNAPSKALDVTSAAWAKANNKELKIYEYQTSTVTQQKWIVADSGHGAEGNSHILRLVTKESVFGANDEKCLEIGSGNKSNSKPVQTWDADKNDASKKKQQWVFEKTPTGISLNVTGKKLPTGNTFKLTATVTPSDAINKTVTWSSSNQAIATVDSTGKVKGIAVGTATITAKSCSGKTATCKFTVYKEYVTKGNLTTLGWYNSSLKDAMVYDLNRVLGKYGITTKENIRLFLSQATIEGDHGNATTEYADGSAYEGRTDLGNTQPGDGPKFKGGGYIQITGRSVYQAFANAVGDQKIVTQGVSYVAANYAWEAAGYYWSQYKKNSVGVTPDSDSDGKFIRISIDSGIISTLTGNSTNYDPQNKVNVTCNKKVARVTRIVNGGYNHLKNRNDVYLLACQIWA
jgi:uncharacterized protein YjdB/predicted chitinase